MTYLKISFLGAILLLLSACSSKYDYTVHKPKVRYKPTPEALTKLNRSALGKPYIWAEERACKGFDCSGLTYYNYGTMGIEIPRTANEQFHCGTPVARSDLKKGDLVFFATKRGRPNFASHVGIYLGNGKFEHASSAKRRVTISSLNSRYYRTHYIGARRYHDFDRCKTAQMPQITPQQKSTTAYAEMISNTAANTERVQPIQQIADTQGESKKEYFISLGKFNSIPTEIITRLQLSGYPTKIEQKGNQVELEVGPFESANEAYSMLDLNRGLFGDQAVVKGSL